MKKEFTKEELYKTMKYIVYCLEVGTDCVGVKGCQSHASYREFLKSSKIHCGDCTQEPATCLRCMLNGLEIDAQNIVDYLFFDSVGHCGKKCVSECDCHGEEQKKEIRDNEDS